MKKFGVRYTYEILTAAAKVSTCINGTVRTLGLQTTGSNNRHIAARLKKLGVDTSHFNRDLRPPKTRLGADGYQAIRQDGSRRNRKQLKKILDSVNRPEKCEKCDCGPSWANEPLVLQIDHKNNNILDDTPENLRYLCPNCHSQTESYSRCRTIWSKPKRFCKCGKEIYKSSLSGVCRQCQTSAGTKSRCPSRDLLAKMIWENPTTKVAKEFGVSDKAITKWCRKLGIEKPGPGYWMKKIHPLSSVE